MLEPVNTVLKGIRCLSPLPADHVLVIGQGPIGLLFTRVLTLQGMNVAAADLFERRLEWDGSSVPNERSLAMTSIGWRRIYRQAPLTPLL